MNWLARGISRNVWAAMLWLMRRRWMRRLQRGSIRLYREGPARERAWASFRRQERFARRYGLTILTYVVLLCLYSLSLLAVYQFLTFCIEEGWLPVTQV